MRVVGSLSHLAGEPSRRATPPRLRHSRDRRHMQGNRRPAHPAGPLLVVRSMGHKSATALSTAARACLVTTQPSDLRDVDGCLARVRDADHTGPETIQFAALMQGWGAVNKGLRRARSPRSRCGGDARHRGKHATGCGSRCGNDWIRWALAHSKRDDVGNRNIIHDRRDWNIVSEDWRAFGDRKQDGWGHAHGALRLCPKDDELWHEAI